ncbi:undecaprenyl/decaprenyl-phosphate alpha-N-acetylglucosaminyl 1-phosphate transferase [Bacteroides fragilis]|uniref:undecaprenyl/decaprenyl-phosphate alpha-N-acetylglucosaminyl 1-phosphate transferase n=1 Tax=Phocaeicola dorei TaxID=357276 RepID=UPI003FEE40B9|nr:undecaprenyl/decaprenyl-phosphate alpha-N-acetylglucosaminyl 1-phosphate transferase [Bacteroides fragilis]
MLTEYFSLFSVTDIFWIVNSIAVFLTCVLCAGLLIPKILLISFRKQLFDQPDERKIHKDIVPRLGGIAFKPVMFFSVALMLGLCQFFGYDYMLENIAIESRSIAFSFCCIMLLYLMGIADDLIGIRYKAKFVGQITCGIMMIVGGMWVNNLHGLFGIHELPIWFGYPLTILVIVFIINSINLIDGIDGLASGLCGVATLFYGIIFFMLHEYIYALLSFATLGVLVPFFYYNVFGDADKQKKIFMGDTGSLTIGMMLCVLSLKLLQCSSADASSPLPNLFVLAYSPLLVPCLDVVRVYMHRVRNGKNPFLPDTNHIHHKLLALGLRQRTAMMTIVAVSIFFTLCNVLISKYISVTILLFADALAWTLLNIWLTHRICKIKKKK